MRCHNRAFSIVASSTCSPEEWVDIVEQHYTHLESLDKNSLTELILRIQRQVVAQEELLHELHGLLQKDKPNLAEPAHAEAEAESSCPYCQCDWVYRGN